MFFKTLYFLIISFYIYIITLNNITMTNQEKWDEILNKIEDLGWELQAIFESIQDENDPEMDEGIEMELAALGHAVDGLRDQEIRD